MCVDVPFRNYTHSLTHSVAQLTGRRDVSVCVQCSTCDEVSTYFETYHTRPLSCTNTSLLGVVM